jgi:hypothetical protein
VDDLIDLGHVGGGKGSVAGGGGGGGAHAGGKSKGKRGL